MQRNSAFRNRIREEVQSVSPWDEDEKKTKRQVLEWIDSGADLCRLEKPAVPDKHLVAYFPVIDGDYFLLADHIKAQLWLPAGGHVEPGEHPKDTARREAKEELAIQAHFLFERPIFLTSTVTVGKTAGHTDVSIWYALKGDRQKEVCFDQSEFHTVRWFKKDSLPYHRTDPQLKRFVAKFCDLAT